MPLEHWEIKAAEKRASILAKIPPKWRLSAEELEAAAGQRDLTGLFIQKFLTAEEVGIVTMDSVQIVDAIRDGTRTALEVTNAFCKAAAIAHQIGNCLHEIFFDQAIERARKLDDMYIQGGHIAPLHGLPVSLKDQFHVQGVDTTMGYVGYIGSNMNVEDPQQIHKVESQITTELLSLGAILYCKTSLPQTLLFGETKNNIIGETLNPKNRNLSCGGSSGGEGALQALRGSSLGVGTDIAGSVRIPAAFNGLFALKPTPERVSYRDAANTNPGQTTYRSAVGFISTSLGGLILILESILSTKPWLRDAAVVPIPFRRLVFEEYLARAPRGGRANPDAKPLKLGIMWHDGMVSPHPPVVRGLRMVVDAVREAGHQVVDWNPPSQATAKDVHISFLVADGGRDIHTHLSRSGEPLIPDLRDIFALKPPMDLGRYQDVTLRGLLYEAQYSDYWNSTAGSDDQIVDAVIMPVAPHAAVIPGKYYHTAYTEAINLLNYSAVVIPVTHADKFIDVVDKSYQPLNDIDRKNHDAYDPDLYDGGPVGVQLVARKFEEEKILAIAKLILEALNSAKSRF